MPRVLGACVAGVLFGVRGGSLPAQEPQPTLPARVAAVLERDGSGHSPTAEEISAVAALQPQPSADEMKAALPALLKTLESSDVPVRTYGLTLLAGLEVQPPAAVVAPAPAEGATPPAQPGGDTSAAAATAAPASTPETMATLPGLPVFRPEIAGVLTPGIPQIAAHLTDEVPANRVLTATILGGFSPNPPPALYPPLLAYLKRDDAVGPIGLLVVGDLLQVGPVSDATAAAIGRFLARSDQTVDTRANLVDAISYKPYQNQSLNKVLLGYLDSDSDSLRARVILSLPALDLAPDVFADARSRVQQLAESPGEGLQVVNAAKAVAPCWTQVKMTSGCPSY